MIITRRFEEDPADDVNPYPPVSDGARACGLAEDRMLADPREPYEGRSTKDELDEWPAWSRSGRRRGPVEW